MKTTYLDIDKLTNAYNLIPFKGVALLDSAVNIYKLEPHHKALIETKKKLIVKLTGGKEIINNTHEKWEEYASEFDKILLTEVEVGELTPIKRSNLDLDRATQNIQGFLAVLLSLNLLTDDPAPK